MKEIPLTKGKFALVDDDDFEWLSQWKWYFLGGYAVRGERPRIFMHREINHTPDGMETDHVNNNRLDNRRENLRSCIGKNNRSKRSINKNNTSGYKGVSIYSKSKKGLKWCSRIGGEHIRIGIFFTPEEAAHAYDRKAIELFGEFAKTNF